MPTNAENQLQECDEDSTGTATDTKTPTRTINVEVPEPVYWHIRKCAIESRLSMKEYMTRFCGEAWDYPQELQVTFQAAEQPGTPQKFRTINVEVPEAVYWRIRKCATESHQSLKGFMAMFCQEAQIYATEPTQMLADEDECSVNTASTNTPLKALP